MSEWPIDDLLHVSILIVEHQDAAVILSRKVFFGEPLTLRCNIRCLKQASEFCHKSDIRRILDALDNALILLCA